MEFVTRNKLAVNLHHTCCYRGNHIFIGLIHVFFFVSTRSLPYQKLYLLLMKPGLSKGI